MNAALSRAIFLLGLGAALFVGCSSENAASSPNGQTASGPDSTTTPSDDQDSGEDEDDAAPSAKDAGRDANKPKDAGHTSFDASVEVDADVPDVVLTTDASAVKDASATDASAACNSISVGIATPNAQNGFAALNGGTLVDGVYLLTKSTRYISGTSGTTFPPKGEGITVNGSQLELRITAPSFALSQSYSYTFTTSGNQIKLTRTCPGAGKETWYFDVQGSTLTIYNQPGSNSIWYDTFEKQP